MEVMSYEKRKSHLVHQGADGKAPVWQGVGSVTILGREIDRPLFLDGVDYTVFFREAKREGDLREAVILLRAYPNNCTVLPNSVEIAANEPLLG